MLAILVIVVSLTSLVYAIMSGRLRRTRIRSNEIGEIDIGVDAIESIALFSGLIISVRAPIGRRAAALAVSIISIYILKSNRFNTIKHSYTTLKSPSLTAALSVGFVVSKHLIARLLS